jgi:hypothetical protein
VKRPLRPAFAATLLVGVACSGTAATVDGTSSGGGASSGSAGTSGAGGSSGTAGSSGTSSSSGTTSSSGTSGSAGTTSSSGTSGSAGDAGTGTGIVKKGSLTVSQTKTVLAGKAYFATYAFASFYQYDSGTTGPCATATIGTCTVTTCTLGGGTPDAGVVSYPNAGTITVTTPAPTTLTLTPTATHGTYTTPTGQVQIWTAGDTITASATGGDAAAFSGKAVTAPNDVVVTSPTFDGSAHASFSRAADLVVGWTGGSVGNVQVMVSTTQIGVRSVSAACTFPAPSGAGAIPAAVMSQLGKADGSSVYGSIVVTPQNDASFKDGDWDVTFRASAGGKSGVFTALD